jgi:hypothetical protein
MEKLSCPIKKKKKINLNIDIYDQAFKLSCWVNVQQDNKGTFKGQNIPDAKRKIINNSYFLLVLVFIYSLENL